MHWALKRTCCHASIRPRKPWTDPETTHPQPVLETNSSNCEYLLTSFSFLLCSCRFILDCGIRFFPHRRQVLWIMVIHLSILVPLWVSFCYWCWNMMIFLMTSQNVWLCAVFVHCRYMLRLFFYIPFMPFWFHLLCKTQRSVSHCLMSLFSMLMISLSLCIRSLVFHFPRPGLSILGARWPKGNAQCHVSFQFMPSTPTPLSPQENKTRRKKRKEIVSAWDDISIKDKHMSDFKITLLSDWCIQTTPFLSFELSFPLGLSRLIDMFMFEEKVDRN